MCCLFRVGVLIDCGLYGWIVVLMLGFITCVISYAYVWLWVYCCGLYVCFVDTVFMLLGFWFDWSVVVTVLLGY